MSAAGPGKEGRRGLVFARVGRCSLHRSWLEQPAPTRSWDLQLSTFEPDLRDDSGDRPLSLDRGTKWDSVARYFRANPELLDRYDRVLFPDDDLLFDPGSFERIFQTCREFDLLIAQPALTPSSFLSHPLLIASPRFRLRYISFIEPMCPCIETSYLKSILWCFERWATGWGQDFVWTHLMDDPYRRAAVIDEVAMTHTRPLKSGQIYEHFARLGIDFEAEMADIQSAFDEVPKLMIAYGGLLRGGRRIGQAPTQVINALHLLRTASSARDPGAVTHAGLALLVRSTTKLGYRPRPIRRLEEARPAAPDTARQRAYWTASAR